MTRTIPLKIQNEYIIGDKVLIGAAGSHNDVVLRMEFSSMWDGLAKTAQFSDALGENVIPVILTANLLENNTTNVYLVTVPVDAKKYEGRMALAIKGAAVSAQKETRATMAAYGTFRVAESNWNEAAETEQDVSATQAEQLQSQIDTILGTIQDARTAAGAAAASASEAESSADDAEANANAAESSANAAAEAAKKAANSVAHVPYIGDNNHWLVWDVATGAYVDTGVYATGQDGKDGSTIVADGLYGFDVDTDSGELHLFYTGDTPPSFSLSADGHLIYTLDSGVSVDIGKVVGPQGDPGITTMTSSAYDEAVAAGTIDADAWYGVFPEEG